MTDIHLAPTFEEDRWVPPPERIAAYRVSAFMRALRVADYAELLDRAAREPDWFYPTAMEHLGLAWMRPWRQLVDESDGRPFARWFVGGGTNLAWLATRRDDRGSLALVWEGDDGATRTFTVSELDGLVGRAAQGLRRLGVVAGDVVTLHLPMIPEAVVAMLAIARIGAIASPAFSGYGVEALAERIVLGGARVVITADGLLRRGERVSMGPVALEASRRAPSAPLVVMVPRLGEAVPELDGVSSWDDLLVHGEDEPAEIFDADHPWLLTFTSGSTGRPKGVVHTHGGMPYGASIDLGLAMDVGPGDRLCWPSDMGWLVGPVCTIVPLILGATAVIFEGVMDHPEPDRLWQVVERHGVTHLGISPTVARMMAQAGEQWVTPYELRSLRILGSTGEPWTTPAWKWLHRHVGRGRAPIVNWAGGTEIGGGILAGSPIVSTRAGRFAGPAPGMAADVVDEEGRSVTDRLGELVLRRSWPSMTRGFWQERDRYLEAYWSRFPDVWVQGDRAIRHSDGSWELPGRSDDLIKVAGKRVGPAELESLATEVPGVSMAGAVGVPHATKGEVPVVVVMLARGPETDRDVAAEVSDRIESALGRPMRPHAVLVVNELPLTRSSKVHRRALRAWLSGSEPGDLSSLENPRCESLIRAAVASLEAPT